jgi:hypothetical protein
MSGEFIGYLALFFLIIVPVICGAVLLVSIALLFTDSKKKGLRLLLGSIIIAIVSFIIGLSICSMH